MRDGPLAAAIVEHLVATGGLVTAEDLRDYRVVERRPLEISYRGLTLLTNPPPSSGGALIAVALSEAEQHPPPRGDVAHYRTVARAGAVANALRGPEFDRDLQEEDAIERLWARRVAGAEGADRWPVSRKPTGSTTHISAVDGQGGMASLSSSNGSGSGVVVPGTGILLNNMLGEEDLNPGGFGRLTAGARMTSMMAPTLLLRGGEPVLALGLGRLEPPALGHPPDPHQRRRRRARASAAVRTPPRAPRGRRRGRRGGSARGGGRGARRRRPRRAALGGGRACSSAGSPADPEPRARGAGDPRRGGRRGRGDRAPGRSSTCDSRSSRG